MVIDREDGSGNATPNAREVIAYTGISGSDLTGVTRAFSGSTGRSHADGALVEAVVDVTLWNDLRDAVNTALSSDGTGLRVSNATVTALANNMRLHIASIASIAEARIQTRLDISAASVTGVGITPVWVISGQLSGATTDIGRPLVIPRAATLKAVNVISRSIASNSSIIFDINNNFSSIFQAGTRPAIAGGGTFVSTASINSKGLVPGNVLTVDLDAGDANLWIRDITIMGLTE